MVHENEAQDAANWEAFQQDMDGLDGLKWVSKKPSTSINFMDLTITIKNGCIETTIYKKEQNLYLYIPPLSSHPTGILTGLVYGQVLRVRRLCTHEADATGKIKQFFDRLVARGHTANDLLPLFRHAKDNATKYLTRTHDEVESLRKKKLLASQKQVLPPPVSSGGSTNSGHSTPLARQCCQAARPPTSRMHEKCCW